MLLKDDGVLPLDKTKLKHIVVVGANAKVKLDGNYEGRADEPITIYDGIVAEAGGRDHGGKLQGSDPRHPAQQTGG